ncbi:hypothetical protein RFI_39560 [Reticulomyxa filosa]|uniref:Uncharacterized protein n=1 Tax=Reticulomyxa filosa TaxID=46433 RepID=X6LA12_RETFI|nr:hypothetical protein RFI_39560 [Reticulomyxa filosa]|eukprot:ETN97961.1 hypothetical protein RFI_39560 [Reticulomyxa filosa]
MGKTFCGKRNLSKFVTISRDERMRRHGEKYWGKTQNKSECTQLLEKYGFIIDNFKQFGNRFRFGSFCDNISWGKVQKCQCKKEFRNGKEACWFAKGNNMEVYYNWQPEWFLRGFWRNYCRWRSLRSNKRIGSSGLTTTQRLKIYETWTKCKRKQGIKVIPKEYKKCKYQSKNFLKILKNEMKNPDNFQNIYSKICNRELRKHVFVFEKRDCSQVNMDISNYISYLFYFGTKFSFKTQPGIITNINIVKNAIEIMYCLLFIQNYSLPSLSFFICILTLNNANKTYSN